jgi:hypothetical protein
VGARAALWRGGGAGGGGGGGAAATVAAVGAVMAAVGEGLVAATAVVAPGYSPFSTLVL